MADLFGEWIPYEWIKQVFDACEKAPQHRYLFLTKNPNRYLEICEKRTYIEFQENFWFGTTATMSYSPIFFSKKFNTFASVEPLMSEFDKDGSFQDVSWVIVGAETGNRKGKIIPTKQRIANIVDSCRKYDIPVFLKNSLKDIWGEELIQEFPFERKKGVKNEICCNF